MLCGVCIDDYQFSGGECSKCPEGGGLSWLSYLVIVLGVLLAAVIIVGLTLDPEADKHRQLRELFDIMDFSDGVSDELIEKGDLQWVVQQLVITESLEDAQRNLLESIDILQDQEIAFSLFLELITEGDGCG